jgi:hypothetical protein
MIRVKRSEENLMSIASAPSSVESTPVVNESGRKGPPNPERIVGELRSKDPGRKSIHPYAIPR